MSELGPAIRGTARAPGAPATDDEMLAGIAADLCACGRPLAALSRGLTLAGAVGAVAALVGASNAALLAPGLAAVATGLWSLWLDLRVDLDARLFHRLAGNPDLAAFDAAMRTAGLLPADKAGRPLGARVAGAKQLLRLQVIATVLQIVLPIVVAAFFAGEGI